MSLTKREDDLLKYIHNHTQEHGIAPTFREMMRGIGLSSPGTIYKLVKSLKAKGVLHSTDNTWRAIKICKQEKTLELLEIPLVGSAAKGTKIEMYVKEKLFLFPKSLINRAGKLYALLIRDNSFIHEYLLKNDTVIILSTTIPQEGATTIVSTEGKGIFFGKYRKEKKRICLESLNQESRETFTFSQEEAQILGIVVAQTRQFY